MKDKRKNKKIKLQPFSLIEMFAVMVLLVFIMLICFTMLYSSEEVFSSSSERNKIFSSVSRVFYVISRDLQSSIYEDDKISFWHSGQTENKMNFIAVRDSSKICEIRYRMKESDTYTNIFNIQRSAITPEKHNWNFYEKQLSDSGTMHAGEFNNLMKNVTELKFTCFKEDGTEITPSASTDTEYPFSVKIDITCMSDNAASKYSENNSDEYKEENERKFSKTVYLGNRR